MKTIKCKSCFTLTGLLLMMVITMTGCAGHKVLTKPVESENRLHFSQLKNWDETKSLNNYAVYVNKGDTIPLVLSMDTDFMEFKQDQIDIVAKQKLYFMIKMPENLSKDELARLNKIDARSLAEMGDNQKKALLKNYMLYVSKDALHWAPLCGGKAFKEVLGFRTGTLSLGMTASTTDGLEANLNIKALK